ncbi:hypothetical protein DET61_11065 [Marinobacter nauticus]|uniref:Big-1 domain-containing protein n=1 Tax=Marinobacter nauticus TaxID=2743 RepID=A0A368XHM3_MARNT|nr:hypothetical protein [Marinobacter nauticus]RCW66518.1 hypothetical protein DET61_11065 [Marinobacter nauticus]
MSGKFLARASALSLAVFLAACGGDDSSTPIVNVNSDGDGSGGTTSGGSQDDTGSTTIAIGTGNSDTFVEGQFSASPSSIPAGGTSILGVSVVNASAGNSLLAGEEVSVEFTSRCISSGESSVSSPAITNSGLVEVEYQSNGCSGDDVITASVDNATAQATVSIEAASPYSISSNPPVPESIAPVGNANSARPSTSTVTFTVIDEDGNPVRGANVTFTLSYSERANPAVEDVRLDRSSATSGPGGEASVRVRAGQQNTVVRVIATIVREDGSAVSIPSPPISVNSFLPDQDSFSMSISNFMPNAQNYNNQTTEITINGGDRFNNNDLEDGNAVVNFVASGGSIDNYCVLDSDGICTVTWRSTDPRPANGRVAILARTVGDESFRDLNSNDEFDNGEFSPEPGIVFEKGEAYLDFNADRSYTAGVDQFFDYNGDSNYNGPDGTYDGSACLSPDSNNCSAGPVTVWDQGLIVMASDSGITGTLAAGGAPNQYCLAVSATTKAGQPVPLPVGTTIDFEITDGTILSSVTSFELGNTYISGNTIEACVLATEDTDPATTALLKAIVTPPEPYTGSPVEFSSTL